MRRLMVGHALVATLYHVALVHTRDGPRYTMMVLSVSSLTHEAFERYVSSCCCWGSFVVVLFVGRVHNDCGHPAPTLPPHQGDGGEEVRSGSVMKAARVGYDCHLAS